MKIVAESDPFDAQFRDPPSKVIDVQKVMTISRDFAVSVQNAIDFSTVTNRNLVPYFPSGPNSNSYASTFVESLTGSRPNPKLNAPGHDYGTPSKSLSYTPSQQSGGGNVTASSGSASSGSPK